LSSVSLKEIVHTKSCFFLTGFGMDKLNFYYVHTRSCFSLTGFGMDNAQI